MASDIVVPTLGESVTEATVAQWLKKVGDAVAVDEPLVELETDKVTLEVNATEAGVLSEMVAAEGDNVEVGALLGRIGEGAAASAPAPKEAPTPAPPPPMPEPAAPTAAPTPADGGSPSEILVPTLGESVTEATVAQWLKQPGATVAADEPLVELETDKVTLEVNAPSAGVLQEIRAETGATVEVGALLGIFAGGATAAASAPAEAPAAAPAPSGDSAPGPSHQELSPAVRKMIGDHSLDPAMIPGTGRDGRITKEDVQAFLDSGGAAARVAPSAPPASVDGLDPGQAARSGAGGKITRSDLESFLGLTSLSTVGPPPETGAPAAPREERVRMTRLRQTVARRLKEAQNTAAMLTTFNEADMSAVMAARARYRDAFEKKHGVRLGFTSFFTKAVVNALKEIPAVNASIEGDELVYRKYYDIGMAVSTPTGLMVPVVRDCDKKSFAEIEGSLAELAKKGRDGKLSMDEMTGGSFTITNGGVFGSLLSTPILNMPQSGILGLHKIQERPMAVNGKVEVRPMMYLALSYDHRIIDGREAVTFLVRVKECIEDPERLLMEV
ncbi:MAG: 2-oxoglutarate dehydrogenase complex dihydrolipoyllysine-residue succinyltransferase [Pseudomonadota bacterium]